MDLVRARKAANTYAKCASTENDNEVKDLFAFQKFVNVGEDLAKLSQSEQYETFEEFAPSKK